MSRVSALSDLLGAVIDRSAQLVDWSRHAGDGAARLAAIGADLMSSRGEASGVALAVELLAAYRMLDEGERTAFFRHLAEEYDPDPDKVAAAAGGYANDPGSGSLADLLAATEPPRQELFRRLNMAPGGTAALVAMRADLLPLLRDNPELRRIDADFQHLLRSWFNRGFLVLRPVDWSTPAAILEKIIAYEAVHEIDSWDELRRRVKPADRRCFAFFHPSMPEEPLIFVEVALMAETPGSIGVVLDPERAQITAEEASTAVFYSISNCQKGLFGVSFGAFLIKQVAQDLARALPRLKDFVTLSPAPGFVGWMRHAANDPDHPATRALARLETDDWREAPDVKQLILSLAASYYLGAKRPDNQPVDPVARFHLGNGAELSDIHFLADPSDKGIAQAAGVMVNYRYRLDRIELNHESYTARQKIAASRKVRALKSDTGV